MIKLPEHEKLNYFKKTNLISEIQSVFTPGESLQYTIPK